jgi:acetyl esterase/lipase
MKKTFAIFLYFFLLIHAHAQTPIPLWPAGKMPNSKGLVLKDSIVNDRAYQIASPVMYGFFPSKDDNNGAAILIFPGGGYDHLTYDLGGFQLAKWFNTLGMSAFVVNYRLPTSPDLKDRAIAPLQDAQRAMRIIRANAAKWHIKKDKIGAMGTSAGGHLASLLGTHNEDVSIIRDELDTLSFRPDFMILISPVIDLGKYAHSGSSKNLLGNNPSQDLIIKYSTQNSVSKTTPICFLADAFNDKTVPPMNCLLFYQALLENNISTSYHVFPQGGHAIGLSNNPGSTELWKILCETWLKEMGITSKL